MPMYVVPFSALDSHKNKWAREVMAYLTDLTFAAWMREKTGNGPYVQDSFQCEYVFRFDSDQDFVTWKLTWL